MLGSRDDFIALRRSTPQTGFIATDRPLTAALLQLWSIVLQSVVLGYGVRIFKTKWLGRFARRERIADTNLGEAIARAMRGQIDADLGGGIIKQRVARAGQGRSGGYRMVVAYRAGDRAVFLYQFAEKGFGVTRRRKISSR
jgi:hypothetical protein